MCTLAGGALGLVLASVGIYALQALGPTSIPRLAGVGIDETVFGYTAGVSVLLGLLVAILPAARTNTLSLRSALSYGGRSGTVRDRQLARGAFFVGEVALALVLLIGSGLMVRTFQKLQSVDPGFDCSRGCGGRPRSLRRARATARQLRVRARMRALADAERLRALMHAFGRSVLEPASIYFTGASAILYGWRGTTIDVVLRFEPESDTLFRSLADLKERLQINIEVASPEDFVPVASDWRARGPSIERHGPLSFHHFDPHAQALAKAERSHKQDVADVHAMLARGEGSSDEMQPRTKVLQVPGSSGSMQM